MSLGAFTWTTRARPVIELGIGDSRTFVGAVWDVAEWDTVPAYWSGIEPQWLDISCDVRTARCEYGRRATTDRFVPGVATIVVDNSTGWADPNTDDAPGVLSVRPGRPIRVSIDHAVYGRRILFRGFVDGMTPTYSPTGADTVELACIDALAEVNRAKLRPLEAPVGEGEMASSRVHRILDAISWRPRDIAPSSETLVGTELGGQIADLLGRTADSAGGAVYGDLEGRVAFRARDWQSFLPGTPPDGTIGNVGKGEPGHEIPGTPAVPGYLTPSVGTVTTPDTAPAAATTMIADPAGAATFHRLDGATRTIGRDPSGALYSGQIRSLQMDVASVPAVPGYLTATVGTVTTPDPGPLPNQWTLVAKVRGPANSGGRLASQWFTSGTFSWTVYRSFPGPFAVGVRDSTNGTAIAHTFLPTTPAGPTGADEYVAVSVTLSNGANSVLRTHSSSDGTTWTPNTAITQAIMTPFDSSTTVRIGADQNILNQFQGRIYWVELRTGLDPAAGTVLWRFDANDYPGTGTVYTDPRGRAWTLTTASAITPTVPAVPARTAWRFDAADYTSGTSYTDPRGRVWTLSAAGAITPTVPETPPVWVPPVPPDVCPVAWERPFLRADITTRAIMGRDDETAVQVDDVDGINRYGIEPFERTDLLTLRDSSLEMFAERVLATRAASTAPRVRSVSLNARTSEEALDLMSTVEVYRPSRYRCRLAYPEPRGLVFDEEHFATGVAHELTPSSWTLELNLDVAAPYAVAGGRWDGAYWDLASWTDAVALIAEARSLIGALT